MVSFKHKKTQYIKLPRCKGFLYTYTARDAPHPPLYAHCSTAGHTCYHQLIVTPGTAFAGDHAHIPESRSFSVSIFFCKAYTTRILFWGRSHFYIGSLLRPFTMHRSGMAGDVRTRPAQDDWLPAGDSCTSAKRVGNLLLYSTYGLRPGQGCNLCRDLPTRLRRG